MMQIPAGGGPTRLVSRLSLCLVLVLAAVSHAPATSLWTDDLAAPLRAAEVHRIWSEAAEMAAPGSSERLEIAGTPTTATLRALMDRELRAARDAGGDPPATRATPAAAYLAGEWERLTEYLRDAPDAAGLRRFHELNRAKYPATSEVSGWRIAVPDAGLPGALESSSATLAWIGARRAAGIGFPQVCAEFHMRHGSREVGHFGPVDPAAFAPEERDLLLSAPLGLCVGPVRVGDVTVLVQVDKRVLVDADPVDAMGELLMSNFLNVRWRRTQAELETSRVREMMAGLRDYATTDPLGSGQTAIELDGRPHTFDDLRGMIPPVFGEEGDPRFWRSVAERALRSRVWADRARARKRDDGLRELLSAWEASVALTRHLDRATSVPARWQLEAYLAAHGPDFAHPDRIDLMEFRWRIPDHVPGASSAVVDAQRAGDLATLDAIVRRWRERPTTATLEADARSYPAFSWRHLQDERVNHLPRALHIMVDQTAPGEPAPVVVFEGHYVIAVPQARRPGAIPPLDAVLPRVEQAWRRAEKERLYRLLAGSDSTRAGE